MKRITFHLSGVKPIQIERRKKNPEGGFDYIKKKICMNTVSETFNNEADGLAYMAHYLENHKGHKVTKHYFTNVK